MGGGRWRRHVRCRESRRPDGGRASRQWCRARDPARGRRRPRGVRRMVPAGAAGCTVVLKPASATPLTALAIAKITEVAGLPPGVFNVLTTNRSRLVGAELLTHPLIRKIGFTGSTDVGKGIMQAAAQQVT